jgi:hypothetical protein
MTYYDLVKRLQSNGFTSVKHYGTSEAWKKAGEVYLIPIKASYKATQLAKLLK